jgi:acyl-CoA dehydrogenase
MFTNSTDRQASERRMTSKVQAIPATGRTAESTFQEALRIASLNADDVDRKGRFPSEAIEALRSAGALGWFVPTELGGEGARIAEIAESAYELSRHCANTGMIFAMHQIQVACIVRHAAHCLWFANYLRRLTREQRLIASATSEMGTGGDLRRSIAAIRPKGDSPGASLRFHKNATTVSYGSNADDLLTTVRRSPEAEAGDQVLVLTHMQEVTKKQTTQWDTLGMRGTCSPGFEIEATCLPDQVLPIPFATIAAETMVPFSHILWAHVWLGLSTDAFHRAQKFVRRQAKDNPGVPPPPALRLSELSVHMAQFRATVQCALREYSDSDNAKQNKFSTIVDGAVRMNNLKIAASEAAVEACQGALRVCGVMGYKNGGAFSIGRPLRDAYSAMLMVGNDRLHATNAQLLAAHWAGK